MESIRDMKPDVCVRLHLPYVVCLFPEQLPYVSYLEILLFYLVWFDHLQLPFKFILAQRTVKQEALHNIAV